MKFTLAASTLALAAGVSAFSNSTGDVYVTEVVTAYTTYCPAATSVVHNGKTYTVSEATTLTITNCPCTITYPASSSAPTVLASSSAPASSAAASSAAASSASASTAGSWVSSPVYSNGTVATSSGVAKSTGAAAGTGSSVASASAKPSVYAGAASVNTVSGAAIAALGAAAFFL